MSKKVNTTAIGLFIIIGLALGVAGALLFSSVRWFSRTMEFVAYFDQSLNGLDEGAPVKYRGVTIGAVRRVMVRYNQPKTDYAMPVILEVDEDLVRERIGDPLIIFGKAGLEERVRNGLRASLQTESLVTGVLYVDIRFNPRAPAPVFHQLANQYPELPTEQTQIQRMFDNLASLDIKGIEENVNAVLVNLNQAVSSLDAPEVNRRLTNLLASLERVVSSEEVTNSLAALRPTLDEYRELGKKLNQKVDPLADGLTNSLAEVNRTLVRFRAAAEDLRGFLAPDSPVRGDLSKALDEMANAAQSVSALVDFLSRHPNALLTGRQTQKKQP